MILRKRSFRAFTHSSTGFVPLSLPPGSTIPTPSHPISVSLWFFFWTAFRSLFPILSPLLSILVSRAHFEPPFSPNSNPSPSHPSSALIPPFPVSVILLVMNRHRPSFFFRVRGISARSMHPSFISRLATIKFVSPGSVVPSWVTGAAPFCPIFFVIHFSFQGVSSTFGSTHIRLFTSDLTNHPWAAPSRLGRFSVPPFSYRTSPPGQCPPRP